MTNQEKQTTILEFVLDGLNIIKEQEENTYVSLKGIRSELSNLKNDIRLTKDDENSLNIIRGPIKTNLLSILEKLSKNKKT